MVTFDDAAAKRFGGATAAHVGERLAIVAGGKCVSARNDCRASASARRGLGVALTSMGKTRPPCSTTKSTSSPAAVRQNSTWGGSGIVPRQACMRNSTREATAESSRRSRSR